MFKINSKYSKLAPEVLIWADVFHNHDPDELPD